VKGARSRQTICNPGLQYETRSINMRNKKVDENKKSEIADRKMKEVSDV